MNNLTEHQKGIAGVFAAAVLWSTGGLFIKLISLNAMQIAGLRSLFAALTILIIFRKQALKINVITFINALFYSAVLIFFVASVKATTVANAIFLQYTMPIYVFVFEPLILKTKFERINLITILICIGGMLLFFMGELSPGDMLGNIFAILSGIFFAAMLIGMRKNKPEYQFSTIFYGNLFIGIICAYSFFEINQIQLSNVFMLSYLGILQIGLAYVIFTYGLKKVNAIEASLISMIEPVLNPIWTFLGYGEVPSTYAIIGGLIILFAIAFRTIVLEKYVYSRIRV